MVLVQIVSSTLDGRLSALPRSFSDESRPKSRRFKINVMTCFNVNAMTSFKLRFYLSTFKRRPWKAVSRPSKLQLITGTPYALKRWSGGCSSDWKKIDIKESEGSERKRFSEIICPFTAEKQHFHLILLARVIPFEKRFIWTSLILFNIEHLLEKIWYGYLIRPVRCPWHLSSSSWQHQHLVGNMW